MHSSIRLSFDKYRVLAAASFAATLCAVVLLSGCVDREPGWDAVEMEPPLVIPFTDSPHAVRLDKVLLDIRYGKRLGSLSLGAGCRPYADLRWEGRESDLQLTDKAFAHAFRDVLQNANYVVAGDPGAMFPDPSAARAVYVVGARITDMRLSVCVDEANFPQYRDNSKGSAYVKVEWQVYSRLGRRVVYTARTEGGWRNWGFDALDTRDYLLNAFAAATSNLLARRPFYDLVLAEPEDVLQDAAKAPLTLGGEKPHTLPLQRIVNKLRPAVITVTDGIGHGSGFIIDREGYALTNFHVVEDAQFVTVTLVTGRELLAEVVRTHPLRDVALLKLEEAHLPVLPLNLAPPVIGQTVYVVGTPVSEDLPSTLTRGVVGGWRNRHEQRYIQADAAVSPGNSGGPLLDDRGNVRGMAVARVLTGGEAGLNLFIPIREALEAVQVECERCGRVDPAPPAAGASGLFTD